MNELDSLAQFCSVAQLDILEAVIKYKGQRAAARALGCSANKVDAVMQKIRRKASVQGIATECNWTHPVPATHVAKGVSTYFEKTATTPAAWVKADLRQEAYNEMVQGAIAGFLEDVPRLVVPPEPLDFQTDIIPWIQIGDAHLGMLAHAAETNENFDLKIAEHELCAAISVLIDEMPNCERIVVNDLGDFTHYDNMAALTAATGHQLDADGRIHKMIRVYSRVMRFIVDKVLTKAKHVDVFVNQGNHSRVNDLWMAELLEAVYGHSGRVNVMDNHNVFTPYRMGNTLVMVHHSDKCPPARLVGVMTSDYRKDFGETEFHYIDIGHVHHHFVSKEHPSVVIESWNHLAANDKWAHESGYRARKAITVVIRSKTFGDIGRRVLPIEQIRARIALAANANPVPTRQVYRV